MVETDTSRISYFRDDVIATITPPERFTFPFYYEPHPLAAIAAEELQHYLETQTALDHNFGFDANNATGAIGKMFGILVIKDGTGKLGYISAFSGKVAGTNNHPKFVPPVFDMLEENSFFLKEQEEIDAINAQLEAITANQVYLNLKADWEKYAGQSATEITGLKQKLKANKEARANSRTVSEKTLSAQEYTLLEAELIKQSLYDKRQLKMLSEKWEAQVNEIKVKLAEFDKKIENLKNERKQRSAVLQQQLFERYTFLNNDGVSKSLQDIFSATAFGQPPSAAGECATPKLLQYAFIHGYKPLAMAEFWWGASPKSEIRKHKQFYPACTGKCKPILAHMLHGIPTDDNPLLNLHTGSDIEIVFEDEYLIVVNKPAGLRSVPGVDVTDSVYSRLKQLWANKEPLIIHRLDMDTSGLLVVAKTRDVHRHIQKQFLRRTVSKRYTALLSKIIAEDEGEITLPLRADPFNRPQQLVCFETGKKSITRWMVIERLGTTTKIHFWPLTGRTHQLRVHAAHQLGLNAPIIGDDLYGTADKRLFLHAPYLAFTHPKTKEPLSFEIKEDF